VFVLSGRGLCDGPIPRPEESYRLWCVSECDQVKIKTLYTYCERVGRRGKDYETKLVSYCGLELRSRHSDLLRAGRSRDRIAMEATFSAGRAWVVNAIPQPICHGERASTHCKGGWVSLGAALDG
jgi:hypothetical protein